ncbi:bacillithiol system redox-active protein YtxJ [Chitinophaga caeni]|uniref:Bacillithiol system redox-active protein YtxJ n=1 Tax=Chitinophaga caeni TaxID=2029983 RepID=A0A291QVL9_9BACT|nr:bacillithiol system redox-active protein YtxJ [Chitinophaga caeni]ATL47996.1 bacillithiol system redox-active protein YtxJ [Chitinophaga caeni]
MEWHELNAEAGLTSLQARSYELPVLIYKHSTRCSISSMVLNRMERSATTVSIEFYFLDLIRYRNLSDFIAAKFNVPHESPQVLLIKNGECIYSESHFAISMDEIESVATQS